MFEIPKLKYNWLEILGIDAREKKIKAIQQQGVIASPLDYLPEEVLAQVAEELSEIARSQNASSPSNPQTIE